MDRKTYSRVLKEAKDRLERENKIFMQALYKRAEEESKYRSVINSLSKLTDSALEVTKLHEKFESSQTESQAILDVKKEIKITADSKLSLDKEINLSRKRTQKLGEISSEFKRMFGIESNPTIVEIPDSPPRLVDNNDRSNIQQFANESTTKLSKVTQKTAMVVAPTPRLSTTCQMLKQAANKILAGETDGEPSTGNSSLAREKDKQTDKQLFTRRDKQPNSRPDSRSSDDSTSRFHPNKQHRSDPYAEKPPHRRY